MVAADSPRIDTLWLSEPDMIEAGVTDSVACVETMEEALILLADGDYRKAGASANSHGAQINFPKNPEHEGMPAYLGGRFRSAGVKWYGSNTENRNHDLPRSIHVFVLNDAVTGAPLAMMSANLLSAYRTIFDAAYSQRPSIKHVKIKGRSAGSTQRVAEWFRETYPQLESIEIVDSEQAAIEGSDILIAGTSTSPDGPSGFPYFKKEWIKPGALILCPAAARFDDDDTGLYAEWFNENGPDVTYEELLGIPGNRWWDMTEEGTLPKERLVNIGDIAAGRAPGRVNDEQIFCYSIGGMPVEDVAWAYDVYHNALDKGIGTKLNLWESPVLK